MKLIRKTRRWSWIVSPHSAVPCHCRFPCIHILFKLSSQECFGPVWVNWWYLQRCAPKTNDSWNNINMFQQGKGKWRKCKPSDTNKREAFGDRNKEWQSDRWGNTEKPGASASGVRWCGQQKSVRDYLTVWSMVFFKQYSPKSNETCTPGLHSREGAEGYTAPKKTATGHRSNAEWEVRAVPLQASVAQGVSRKLRFPDILTTAQDGGKVSLKHRPHLAPWNTPGTHVC
jgi:hypothetical protein